MSIPVSVAPALLAREAIARTPRLAALFSNAQRAKAPIMISRHSHDPFDTFLGGIGLSSKWVSQISRRGLDVDGTVPAALQVVPQSRQPARTPVHAIYDDLMGKEHNSSFRLKSVGEQIEDAKPVAAGESAVTNECSPEEFKSAQEYELTLLSSAIVSVGFENLVDRVRDGGFFDSAVLSNVRAAASVIAPNRLLSQLSGLERRAISAAAIFGSNASFLQQMRNQNPELSTPANLRKTTQLLDVAQSAPSALKFALGLITNGAVSAKLFAGLIVGEADGAASSTSESGLTMSPSGARQALTSAAATKADHAVRAIASLLGQDSDADREPISVWMFSRFSEVRDSLANRADRFRQTEQPQERDVISEK